MDLDDSADLCAILGLAGAGVALMLVASLDLGGAAVVLAVLVPTLAAGLIAVVAAVVDRHRATGRPAARRGGRVVYRDGDRRGRCHA